MSRSSDRWWLGWGLAGGCALCMLVLTPGCQKTPDDTEVVRSTARTPAVLKSPDVEGKSAAAATEGREVDDPSCCAMEAESPQSGSEGPEACECQLDIETATLPRNYTRRVQDYSLDDVPLVNQHGRPVSLDEVLAADEPIVLQFFFSSCSTICPALTGSLASAREFLDDGAGRVQFISISIDPDFDTPRRLTEFARQFHAGENWHFLGGSRESIESIQKNLDAFQANKMQHEPLTFIRGAPGSAWIRLNGLPGGRHLAAEIERAADE